MKTPDSVIVSHPFFRGMNPHHLNLLTEGAIARDFKTGELLFREGEPANKFYLIEAGEIAIEQHITGSPDRRIEILKTGDVLGWSWLFPPFSWHFQARAVSPVNVIVLSGAHLLVTAENDHDFGYELLKRVAKIVLHRLQSTRKQLSGASRV